VLVDVVVVVVVNVVGDGDETRDASSGRADGREPICTRRIAQSAPESVPESAWSRARS
jgi:hypothetical protein